MSTNIKIGLTYTGSEEKNGYYVNWLKGNDDIEIIRLSAEDDNLQLVKEVDAIVLSGGVDAHPQNYGSNNTSYPNAPAAFQEARDKFETAVFLLAQQLHIPVLGVCRGMQLINCVLGGNLIQDIGEEANNNHRNQGEDKKHPVIILPGTLLGEITNLQQDDANSAHHQCVNHLGKGLKVNATSSDGIIEGIEWADKSEKPFLLGIQWHPERMFKLHLQGSTLSKNIRDYFINQVQKSNAAK
jgi:putative glutamine amidotransferase